MKDPLPNRRRWDPSGNHPYRLRDGNGLPHPHYLCITCSSPRKNPLHSQHPPDEPHT
jgi:hypothetical protein